MSAEHGDAWSELKEVPGIGGLPFPWPVGGAVRLGLHASQANEHYEEEGQRPVDTTHGHRVRGCNDFQKHRL